MPYVPLTILPECGAPVNGHVGMQLKGPLISVPAVPFVSNLPPVIFTLGALITALPLHSTSALPSIVSPSFPSVLMLIFPDLSIFIQLVGSGVVSFSCLSLYSLAGR